MNIDLNPLNTATESKSEVVTVTKIWLEGHSILIKLELPIRPNIM